MVERLEIFSCKFCGAEFDNGEHALNCENSHLHIPDMKLDIIEMPANDEFCYEPQNPWPTFIRIKIPGKSVDPMVFQLLGTRKKRGPSPAGGP